ncbi:MAG: M28 family peptidase, partial [Bryobacterales bacterium]|nr:M28 family peptidase [Bryobacterales bacterium]
QIQDVARRYELTVSPDPRPEQGSFFRSDHFPFAKAGVAAFSVNGGAMFVANAEASAARLKEYGTQNYHQPSDEYRDDWDFSNMEYLARFGAALGQEAANAEALVKLLPVEPRKPVLTGAAKPARRLHRAAPRRRK